MNMKNKTTTTKLAESLVSSFVLDKIINVRDNTRLSQGHLRNVFTKILLIEITTYNGLSLVS